VDCRVRRSPQALRRSGRQRNIEKRAEEIQLGLRAEQLEAPALIANAHALVTRSATALIRTFNTQVTELEAGLSEHFEQHPDAKVVLSLPGPVGHRRSTGRGELLQSVVSPGTFHRHESLVSR
jgi:hypothetical protein